MKWVQRGLIALLAVVGLYWGMNAYWEMRHLDRLNDAKAQNEMLASVLPGFRCDEMEVIEVLTPSRDYVFDGGAYLKVSENCQAELRSRVQGESQFQPDVSGDCFSRDSITWTKDICFKGDRVYFGSPIPG
jgi:hypothetical protein